jgi:hypothetical protein
VTAPSVPDLLRTAQRSAVHLEMRDGYMRSDPMFMAWQRGDRIGLGEARPWLDLMAELTGRGVVVRRARIISEPVSEYIRFEYEVTDTNTDAGEQVRWLPRRRANGIPLPANDFWLVDNKRVLWNHFTGEGEIHPDGKELTDDPAEVELCRAAFEAVWQRGIPHQEYKPRLS